LTLNSREAGQLRRDLANERRSQTLNTAEGRRLQAQMRNYDPVPSPRAVPAPSSSFNDLYVKTAEITNLVDFEFSRQTQRSTPEGIRTPDISKGGEDDFQTVPLQTDYRVGVASNRPTEELVAEQLAQQNVHNLDFASLEVALKTSISSGLSDVEHAHRLAVNGPNTLTPPKKTPWFIKLGKFFIGGFQILLMVAALLCFILYGIQYGSAGNNENLYCAAVLILVVSSTALFSYYQGHKSESLMEKFSHLTSATTRVIRGGQEKAIGADDLVVGDLVAISSGDRVPADLIVVAATGLKVNNSSLTGESEALSRTTISTHPSVMESKNVMFCGTFVFEGSGLGIVFQTGDETVIGQVAKCTTGTEKKTTHLKQEINHFVWLVVIIAVTEAILFMIVAFAAYKYPWQSAIGFCIGVLLSNVAEGLLPQICTQLYITAKMMAKLNVVVKNLEIIETLGCVSCIASDKTGTLTQNLMTVSHLEYDSEVFSTGAVTTNEFASPEIEKGTFQMMLNVATLCSSASLVEGGAVGDTSNPTEKAIVKYFGQYVDLEKHRDEHSQLGLIPFNSNNKYMLTVCSVPETHRVRLYMKGAPERVMARCETILLRGETVPIGPLAAAQEGFSTQLASKGERVLGFAYLDLDPSRFPAGFKFNMDEVNFPTSGLTFVGLVSLIDPPRPGVQESIAICKKAGIRVIMVTGDHPITAEAIARSIGILQAPSETSPDFTSQERVIPGDKLNDMTDEQWEEAFCSQGLVFARTLPQQKQMIVSRLQDRGEIVAVTGDGVNDSPALKQASCGIAMGIMGSEIAKDAADIVLMDDNFCSIVAGIRQGRLTFTNVQKCCVHVMPHMQPELFTVILYIVIGIPSALNNLQLLTIDLGTDIPLGISLAWEAPEDEIMARPPRRVDERLTSWRFYFLVYLQLGLFETAYCFFVFFLLFSDHGFSFSSMLFTNNWFTSTYDTMDPADQISCDIMAANNHVWQAVQNDWGNNFDNYRNTILAQAQAAYLACVTICQMGAILGDKTQFSSFFTVWLPNWHIWIAFCIAITFSMLLTYTPIGWVIFQTAPINFKYYGIMLGGAVMMFSYHEIIKFCMRRSPNGLVAFFVKY